METQSGNRLFLVIAVVIFVGGFAFWTSDLSSDPPMYYSGLGQSLSTDPAQYLHHARNEHLFGQFDPFDYPRWTVYQHSLVSLVGYIWFSITEVSSEQANLIGIILCFGAFAFFLLGLRRHHHSWVAAAVILCLVINVTLLTHGRLSYLENGLLFLGALLFFIYSRWGDRTWGIALSGAVVALAALIGKLFGLLLLPALLLAIYSSNSERRFREMICATFCFGMTLIVTAMSLYGANVAAAFGYIGEQSYGLRGFPAGLTSPWAFVEHLISFGQSNRLFYLDPDILIFLLCGGICLVLLFASGKRMRDFSPALRLALFWTAAVFVGLMPLNYSPIRYTVILLPAIVIACFALADNLLNLRHSFSLRLGKSGLTLLGLLIAMFLFHLLSNIFYFNVVPHPSRMLTWSVLPAAVLIVFILWKFLGRRKVKIGSKVVIAGLVLILIFSATANGFRIRRFHYLDNNFNLAEARLDIEQIVGDDAVISGPYAPALTMDTRVKSFIHLFGVASVDSTLFDRYPITHLAVDVSNWNTACKDYPQLASLEPITSYWIRDYEVRLYNISKVFSNAEANSYRETNYEQALSMLHEEQPDSSLALAEQFVLEHPESKSAGVLLVDLLSSRQEFDRVKTLLVSLADRYPTDFFIQMQCGRFLQILGLTRGDQSLMELARWYYERGVNVNRYKAGFASQLYGQTMTQYGQSEP